MPVGAGSDAKEAGLGVDGVESAILMGPEPGDVIAHEPRFPAFVTGGGNEHGEIGFPAGAGKGGGDVGAFARRVLDAQNQHVLRQPAFITGGSAGNAEGEAFFAQQGIAPIAAAVAPDALLVGEMDDVFFWIAGPGNITGSRCQRRAHAVDTGDVGSIGAQFIQDGGTHPGHDPHADHDVGAVGDFHADFAQRGIQRPHAEGHDIEGPPGHASGEEGAEGEFHLRRIDPIVGGSGIDLAAAANVSAIFHAGDIAGI